MGKKKTIRSPESKVAVNPFFVSSNLHRRVYLEGEKSYLLIKALHNCLGWNGKGWKGKERKGKERQGNERQGMERQGNEMKGKARK